MKPSDILPSKVVKAYSLDKEVVQAVEQRAKEEFRSVEQHGGVVAQSRDRKQNEC
ncbi:MAG: hypothetical protein IPK99_17360 [Flavobacteriales bacterium]|nr:hypothetical protein [Flavobacteriales bacterium]